MAENERIKYLLNKYLRKEHTPAEARELFDHLRTVYSPEELEDLFLNHWRHMAGSQSVTELTWQDILEKRKRITEKRQAEKRKSRTRIIWRWSVAASVLLIIGMLWWTGNEEPAYITYSTDFGETREIVLDDGTTIVLNANSELQWKKSWKKDKMRFAELKGEAFFEVAHVDITSGRETESEDLSRRMPFHVKSADMVIEVLGTSFNVEERRGETKVYLEEGSVKLNLLEKEANQNPGEEMEKEAEKSSVSRTVLMEPGETVQYSAQTREWIKLEPDLASSITEWKDGVLMFEDVRFGDMLQRMEDIYGKSFEVADSNLLNRRVFFAVPYENWEVIRKLTETTLRVEFKTGNNEKIIIKNRKE